MRAAPAVDYPVARDGFWRGGVSLACGLAGLAVAAWVATWWAAGHAAGEAATAVAAAGGLATAAAAGWRWSRPPEGRLHWNGEHWHLRTSAGAAEPGQVEIALDWGDWVLLRWYRPTGRWRRIARHWLPLTRSSLPLHWHRLRVALHASPPRGVAP